METESGAFLYKGVCAVLQRVLVQLLGNCTKILIRICVEMSFHHRVTQSITEFYSFDFKLIKLCETLCYSVVN
ncbi:MAG: hypothetical protein EGR83_08930 [Bacteroides cellulosilyticus]|nr:hypothetical protein [Bacteroides cellulosilyticus]